MQLGFLGALGGAARAGSDVMDERIRSAAEQKRLDTINQFTIDAEGRANTEYAIRKETEIRQKYGQGAIDNPSGYLAGERESEARARFGDEANLALGTDPLTRKGAMDDWTEQQKAAVGFHRQRDDNTVAAQGKWTQENHPERGWGEVNSTTGQWRPLSPGAGSVHGKSAEGSGGPLGAPGTKVPKSVFTDIRADYAHRINPGDMALAAAASEGDEAFMRYIEQTGQLGSLYEFAAKPPYGIDLRTGTYLDMNAQPQQGGDLPGGSGFSGAGASPTPARTSGEPAPQPGSTQPPADQVGLLTQTEAAPAQWDRSGGSSTPTRVPAQEAGASPAEKAIENHPDMAARVRARALLNEAQELLAADPGKQAVIEQALAKRLREMGIRL